MAIFTEWLGSRALTPVAAHWFAPASSTIGDSTDYFAAVTGSYDGTAPYDVTLTRTRVDFFGNTIAETAPIASYNTGPLFAVVGDRVSPADEDVFFTAATPGAAAGTSDLMVQRYDPTGQAIGGPSTLVSGIAGFDQLRVGSAATYGQSYLVAYSTFDTASGAEAINLLTYGSDNALDSVQTLDSFSTGNGQSDPFGFGTLDSGPTGQAYLYLKGYEVNGRFGILYQKVSTTGAREGESLFIAPRYPVGSSNQSIGSWTWTRLDGGSHDLAVAMPYSYTDATGTHHGLDVRFIDTTANQASDDTIALGQTTDTRVTLARQPDGSLVVGYTDEGVGFLREYDATGAVVGNSSFALPSAVTTFNISALGDGRILLEYPQVAGSGNQLVYDIYDTRQTGVTLSSFGGGNTDLAGTVDNDAFIVNGAQQPDVIVGAGGTDLILTGSAAGTGTVLVDLRDGVVSKGLQLDARLYGIQGVTLGADPSVVVGLTQGTDLIYGGTGTDSYYGQGGTDYIQGGTGENFVVGGAGNEIFYSGGGPDFMQGGSAANFMAGGTSAADTDVFDGTGGQDYVYGRGGSIVLVGSGGGGFLTGGSGYNELDGAKQPDRAGDVGFNVLTGTTGTDVLYAGIGSNLLYEGSGTDVLAGSTGTDYVYGGSGRSFVYGGSGLDVVTSGSGNQYIRAGSGTLVFNDSAATLHAGRFDEIDNLSGSRAADLYLPGAVAGATRFVAQDGGTAILTAVNGGSAEVFVSNASLSTVTAHTHFTL